MTEEYIHETENDVSFIDILYVLRKRYKLIILTISLFLIGGIFYGLYAPKEYESVSILSIGDILGHQIQPNGELMHTLRLLPFQGMIEASKTVKSKYTLQEIGSKSIEILTIARSAQKAYEANLEIIDTILIRHNQIYNEAISPINESITNVEHQIKIIGEIRNHKFPEEKFVTLHSIEADLKKQKNRFHRSFLVLKPRIIEDPVRPNLHKTIFLSIVIGIGISLLLVFIPRPPSQK